MSTKPSPITVTRGDRSWIRTPTAMGGCAQCGTLRSVTYSYHQVGVANGREPAFCGVTCHDRWWRRRDKSRVIGRAG